MSDLQFYQVWYQRWIGRTIQILRKDNDPDYRGKVGTIKSIDENGCFHGTWGRKEINPVEDDYKFYYGEPNNEQE